MVRSVEPSVSHKRLEGFFFCMLFGQQFARPKDRGLSSRRVFGPLSKGGHSCQWRYDEGDGCFMAIGTSLPSALSSGRRIVHAPGHQGFTNVSESGWGGVRWCPSKTPRRCDILGALLYIKVCSYQSAITSLMPVMSMRTTLKSG